MSAGQDFVKKIRPIGSAFFLLLFVLFLITCFTPGKNPIPGYEAPRDSEYYAQSDSTLAELKTELEANVFPKLGGIKSCRITDGKLNITLENNFYSSSRLAILSYYEEDLFEFTKAAS